MTTPSLNAIPPRIPADRVDLPASYRFAAWRGMGGHCPRCGGAALFRAWLKPVDHCSACGQDWSLQRADDFPAYISIFITGHVLAPLMILLIGEFDWSPWATLALVLPLASAMMLGLLQPAKGAVLATMWWTGMGGFTKERAPSAAPSPASALPATRADQP
ncbi:MAG: hypothetical protein RLZZ08_657 [Pseudomonadota bacterium]|jgi:uncharacterized protein (DUF983 family)